MDPVTGSLLLGLAGQTVSAFGQSSANRQNRQIAREQMAFQREMSNTQYQRAVADMRAAGLNPMLAYMQGGAGGASGASADMQNVVSEAPSLVNSAMAGRRLKGELEVMARQADKAGAEAQLAHSNKLTVDFHRLVDQSGMATAYDIPRSMRWRLNNALADSYAASAQSARASARVADQEENYRFMKGLPGRALRWTLRGMQGPSRTNVVPEDRRRGPY